MRSRPREYRQNSRRESDCLNSAVQGREIERGTSETTPISDNFPHRWHRKQLLILSSTSSAIRTPTGLVLITRPNFDGSSSIRSLRFSDGTLAIVWEPRKRTKM